MCKMCKLIICIGNVNSNIDIVWIYENVIYMNMLIVFFFVLDIFKLL